MRTLYLYQCFLFATFSNAFSAPTTTLKTIVVKRDGAPPVSTVGAPSDGHTSGDIIITIPEADNKILSQILSQSVCPDSKLRRRFVSDCFFKNGEAIYGSMWDGGMSGLINMANGGFELPIPPPDLDMGVIGQFEQMGNGVPGLDEQARNRLARIVWWSEYPTLITHTAAENPVKVIPAVVATRVVPAPAETTTSRCHLRDRIPYCSNCGGNDGNDGRITCVGFGDLWKGCPCLRNTPLPPITHYDAVWVNDAWLKYVESKTNVSCLGVNATQDLGLWSKMVNRFCDNVDTSNIALKEGMTIADINGVNEYSFYKNYKFTFGWDPAPNVVCHQPCINAFSRLGDCNDPSTAMMTKSGLAESKCGTARYEIEDQKSFEFEPKCDGELQESKIGADLFKDKIKKLCTSHAKLQDGLSINGPNGEKYWNEVDSEQGFSWSLLWENSKDSCPFDCETVFLPFADSKDCVQDNGLMKTGRIETECGNAQYNAYKLGS